MLNQRLTEQKVCLDQCWRVVIAFKLDGFLTELCTSSILHLFEINDGKIGQIFLFKLLELLNRSPKLICGTILLGIVAFRVLTLEEFKYSDVDLSSFVQLLTLKEFIRDLFQSEYTLDPLNCGQLEHILLLLNV